MEKNSVVIIGGGIAGLSAGIHAQMDGFSTVIYESHFKPGGMCTTWSRDGYKIDNCVHWLSCSKPGYQLNTQWKNVGIVGENVPLVNLKSFYTSEHQGQTLTLWSDFERTRKEMLAVSPEDADQINDFIDTAILETGMQLPTFKPITAVGLFDLPKMISTMKPMITAIKHIGKITLEEYAKRFKHPLIRKLLTDFVPNQQFATSFIASYATIASGNGNFPVGGSDQMIENMVKKYESLGGKILCNSRVEKVEYDKKSRTVKEIMLSSGEKVSAQYFIFATDPSITFSKFLDPKFMPKQLKTRYERKDGNPIFTAFQVALALDGKMDLGGAEELFFDVEKPIVCATKTIKRLNVKTYHDYGEGFAPEGKDIIQVHIKMYAEDWDYWTDLKKKNAEAYKNEKNRIAEEILAEVEKRFPEYAGKFKIIDCWTPATYTKFTGAYYGAYMTFVNTVNSGANYVPNIMKEVKNGFLASNWLMSPGGLPCALAEGYFASWYLKKKAGVK
ncbi:MAG: NAD(P)/FAD-dependent oxidoreductase [Treponema sp.]|nr:NAD(P)/FAD-dependent oxidoreductase [Treponema sp.]